MAIDEDIYNYNFNIFNYCMYYKHCYHEVIILFYFIIINS